MNNSVCHSGHKIWEYFVRSTMIRIPDPLHSPDLSLCNFWPSAMKSNE
jgi:hypothetical protein